MSPLFTGLESVYVQATTPSVPSIRRKEHPKPVLFPFLCWGIFGFSLLGAFVWCGRVVQGVFIVERSWIICTLSDMPPTMTKQWRRWDYIFIAGKSSQHAAERDQIHSSLCGDLSIFTINPKNKPEKWYLRGLSSHFSFCLFVFFCLFFSLFSSYFPLS